jgi:hypothetical protein
MSLPHAVSFSMHGDFRGEISRLRLTDSGMPFY